MHNTILEQSAPNMTDNYAEGINASGEAYGYAAEPDRLDGYAAVEWSPTGQATVLQSVGGIYSQANAINKAGETVGKAEVPSTGIWDAVEWSPTGQVTTLYSGGFGSSVANAINNAGRSVGFSEASYNGNVQVAMEWSPSGAPIYLQQWGGSYSTASAINNVGESVGYSDVASSGVRDAMLWSPSGQATVLQDVGGVGLSEAYAINDAGDILGISAIGPSPPFWFGAVEWSPSGQATVLQDVGGGNDMGLALNKTGEVVGYSSDSHTYSENTFAVEWSPTSGQATVLPNPLGEYSCADAINDNGQIVGDILSARGMSEAAEWSPSGKVRNLAPILGKGWTDTAAVGINNAGDIVGQGMYQGSMESFLLMHVGGATSNHYDLVDHNHLAASSLAAPHKS